MTNIREWHICFPTQLVAYDQITMKVLRAKTELEIIMSVFILAIFDVGMNSDNILAHAKLVMCS